MDKINKNMQEKSLTDGIKKAPSPAVQVQKPNEKGGFHFSSSLKITDPDTGKVILHMRCN